MKGKCKHNFVLLIMN